jgi:hypothetical protein
MLVLDNVVIGNDTRIKNLHKASTEIGKQGGKWHDKGGLHNGLNFNPQHADEQDHKKSRET